MKPAVRLKISASKGNVLAFGTLIVLMGYVCLLISNDIDLETRTKLVYYWVLFAGGIFAVSPPHVLLPDPQISLMQLANLSGTQLLSRQIKRWRMAMIGLALPGFVLAFNDPGRYGEMIAFKSSLFAEGFLVFLGTGLYSFVHFLSIGPVSQAWQEGTKGQGYRTYKQVANPLPMPEGMVPAFLATARIFMICVLVLMAGAFAARLAVPLLGAAPGLALLLWSVAKLVRTRPLFDRFYYQTNSFYGEIFPPGSSGRDDTREALKYKSAYWVPRRWRPQTWISLVQLDRKLPLGRYLVLGHLFLWILFLQGADWAIISRYLVLFILAKNATVHFLASHRLAPRIFQTAWQSPVNWILTRTFVNARWTLSFLMSLLVVAVFDSGFSISDALFWAGTDLAVAFLTASFVTYFTEIQFSKHVQ